MRIYGVFVVLAGACVLSACDEPMFITAHGELGLDATELSLDPLHDPESPPQLLAGTRFCPEVVSWDQGHGNGSLPPECFGLTLEPPLPLVDGCFTLETPGTSKLQLSPQACEGPAADVLRGDTLRLEVHPFEDAALRYDDTTLRLLYAELQPEVGREFPPAPAPEPDGRWRIVAGEPANIGLQLYRQSEPLVPLAYTDGTPVIVGDPAPADFVFDDVSPRIVAAMGDAFGLGLEFAAGTVVAPEFIVVDGAEAASLELVVGWSACEFCEDADADAMPLLVQPLLRDVIGQRLHGAAIEWSIDGAASLDDEFPGDGVVLGDLCTEEFEGQARHLTVTAKYRTLVTETELRFRCPAAPQGDSGLLGCACSAGTDVAPVHGLAPLFGLWCVRRRRRRRATSR